MKVKLDRDVSWSAPLCGSWYIEITTNPKDRIPGLVVTYSTLIADTFYELTGQCSQFIRTLESKDSSFSGRRAYCFDSAVVTNCSREQLANIDERVQEMVRVIRKTTRDTKNLTVPT